MRVLSLIFCLLFIQAVSLAEEPKESPPSEAASAEKEAVGAPAEAPITEQPAKEGKKLEPAAPETPPEEKKEKKKEKVVNIEGGFAHKNVTLHQGSYLFVTQFDGEMVNNSGMDYSIVKFVIGTYDGRGRLLTEESFHIIDFNNGQTKTFKGTAVDGFKEIASFKIRLKSGVAAAK